MNTTNATLPQLKNLTQGNKPKQLIHQISETLLAAFGSLRLIDNYDVYQHLMVYWAELMQDDVYVISDDGWQAGREVYRILKQTKNKDGKTKEKAVEGMDGIESKPIKPYLLINKYFDADKKAIEKQEAERDSLIAEIEAIEEEHGGEEGLLAEAKNDKDKLTLVSVKERLRKVKGHNTEYEEIILLTNYIALSDKIATLNKLIKDAQKALEQKVWDKYKTLTDAEIKSIVVEDKWIAHLENTIHNEMQRISQRLTQRIKELADRYETPLPLALDEVKALEEKVNAHLINMGFVWK